MSKSAVFMIHGARINSVYYRDVYRSTEGLEYLEKAGISCSKIEA